MPQFDLETALQQVDEQTWQGRVHPQWNIGDNPNGGYMVSMAVRAMQAAVPHPDPLSLTTHFLRPGVADAACTVQVEVLRSGRSMSTARATLVQQDKARLEVLAGFGDLGEAAGADTDVSPPAPQLPAVEQCVPRSGATQGVELPIMQRLDVRLHPQQAAAGQAGEAVVSGWIRFADGRPPAADTLALFADAFPPSPLGLLGMVGWVPTVELTVHVRARPAPGWICARFHCEDLQGGRMIESGGLWDSSGRLVAQSRQLGLVMAR